MCNNLHISYYTTYILVATYSYYMYRLWIINLILILIHHHQHHHIAAVSSFLNNYLLPTQPLSPPYLSKMSIVFPSLYFNSNHIIMASYIKGSGPQMIKVHWEGRPHHNTFLTSHVRYYFQLSVKILHKLPKC